MTLAGRKSRFSSRRAALKSGIQEPRETIEAAGAQVTVIGIQAGEAETTNNDLDPGGSYHVDKAIKDVSANDFLRSFLLRAGKDDGRYLSGPLAARRSLNGRTVKTDITNAGGNWVD